MSIKKVHRMYILSFLFTLHVSLSAYVNSTFVSGVVGEHYVGLLYTAASIITLLLLSNTSVILKRLGNRKLTFILLLLNMVSLATFISTKNPIVISSAFIMFMTTNTLAYFCFDIFLERFGDQKTIGRTRGIYLTIINLAWVMSPLITGFLVIRGGYNFVYTIAFITIIMSIIAMFFSIKRFDDKSYIKKPFLETYSFLKKNNHMLAITVINFMLQFFYVWMVIYTPIYLNQHLGIGWDKLGIIFTVMLVPFVILGIPLGKLIDIYDIKKRTLLTVGFIVICISTLLIPSVSTLDIFVWAIILFMTRVGAAIIETTSEIYFFTHVKEEEAYILGVFRDMTPVAYVIAPLLGTLFLTFFPFKYLFLALSIFMLVGLYYISKIKHNHEVKLPTTDQSLPSIT